jgi:hypothetical protein
MYIRKHKGYELNDVIPFVDLKSSTLEGTRVDFDGDMIKMHSDRLKTFATKGCNCVKCGVKGVIFYKERSIGRSAENELYHLNLYGINEKGEEVLMTKDHIIPKSKGGKNHISNYQTMCHPCNIEKGGE